MDVLENTGPRAARFEAQIPCWLRCGSAAFGGLVTNVSGRGVFVRTRAPAAPADEVALSLWTTPEAPQVEVTARVAWQARETVGPSSVAAHYGVGLEIERPPAEFERLVQEAAGLVPVACRACGREVLVAVADRTAPEHPFAYFASAAGRSSCGQRFLEPGADATPVPETCVELGKAVLGALTDGTLELVR